MDYDAIVIGAGIFGQVVAQALRVEGRSVCIIDAALPNAGSGPAACLMARSWYSGLGKKVYDPALELLDRLYGVQEIEFEVGRAGLAVRTNVKWVEPKRILDNTLVTHGHVMKISGNRVDYYDTYHDARLCTSEAPLIVVAAGIWTERLLPEYRQQGKMGVAFLYPRAKISHPFIRLWAPYKQIVGFNRGDGAWASDGTAILQKNWDFSRVQQCLYRCAEAAGMDNPCDERTEILLGTRPYAPGHKPCLLEEVRPGLWVASGGAKNGTIAAGWCAHRIVEATS